MERKGRNLEEVVKLLEEALEDQNIEVKSPDLILDKDTGRLEKWIFPCEVELDLQTFSHYRMPRPR
jgi:hypothetical protein